MAPGRKPGRAVLVLYLITLLEELIQQSRERGQCTHWSKPFPEAPPHKGTQHVSVALQEIKAPTHEPLGNMLKPHPNHSTSWKGEQEVQSLYLGS